MESLFEFQPEKVRYANIRVVVLSEDAKLLLTTLGDCALLLYDTKNSCTGIQSDNGAAWGIA